MENKYICMYIEIELNDANHLNDNIITSSHCGHVYNPVKDDPEHERSFEDLPDDWKCPECGHSKNNYTLHTL